MNKRIGLAVSLVCTVVSLLLTPAVGFAQETGRESASVANENSDGVSASGVAANELTEDTDFDAAMATLSRYIVFDAEGQPRFDAERAEADDASEYLLAAGGELNRYGVAQGESPDLQTRASMPGYGNWCGPGHSGPGAPINTLDGLCQRHDQCYAARGYLACSCDRELIQGIRDNRAKFSGFGENAMALAIATWFNTSPCNPLS